MANIPVKDATATTVYLQTSGTGAIGDPYIPGHQGDLAHDAVDANNPVKMGFQARTSLPTAVASADRVNGIADKFGRQIVLPYSIRDLETHATTTITASTSETTVLAAVASTFLDLVCVHVCNTSATAVRVDFRDTTGGSVIFSVYVAAGNMAGFVPVMPLSQTTVNTNWTAQSSASVTDLRIFVQAIKNV